MYIMSAKIAVYDQYPKIFLYQIAFQRYAIIYLDTFLLIENRNETNIIVNDKDLQDFFFCFL